MSSPATSLPLSKTGQRWVENMRRLWEVMFLNVIIGDAAAIAAKRGGHSVTGADLNAAMLHGELPLDEGE